MERGCPQNEPDVALLDRELPPDDVAGPALDMQPLALAGFQVHFVPHRHSSAPDVLPPPRRGPSVGYCVPAPDVGQLELEVLARAAGSR